MANDLTGEVARNSLRAQQDYSQRRTAVIGNTGEYVVEGAGTGETYITMDVNLVYLSELKFKLVIGTPATIDPTEAAVIWGTNTYPTVDSFLAAFPIGTYVIDDTQLGAQCVAYANAFWRGQVNRAISTGGTGSAFGIWQNALTYNAGTEFDLVNNWNSLKRGDWAVWSTGLNGHIAMCSADNVSGARTMMFYGQNQGGTPVASGGKAIDLYSQSSTGFLGAFRYKGWN